MKLPIDEEGLSKATCQWCGKMFLADSHHGTSNLHRHLLKCLKRKEVKQDGVNVTKQDNSRRVS